MYTSSDELLCDTPASLLGSIVCVVDHDLALRVEEVPDELLTAVRYPLPQSDCLRALLACCV